MKRNMSKEEENDILSFMRHSLPNQLKEFRIFSEHKYNLDYADHKNVLLSISKKTK